MCSEQPGKGLKRVPEDTEMTGENLGVSKPTTQDTTGAKDQNLDSTKGQSGSHVI